MTMKDMYRVYHVMSDGPEADLVEKAALEARFTADHLWAWWTWRARGVRFVSVWDQAEDEMLVNAVWDTVNWKKIAKRIGVPSAYACWARWRWLCEDRAEVFDMTIY